MPQLQVTVSSRNYEPSYNKKNLSPEPFPRPFHFDFCMLLSISLSTSISFHLLSIFAAIVLPLLFVLHEVLLGFLFIPSAPSDYISTLAISLFGFVSY